MPQGSGVVATSGVTGRRLDSGGLGWAVNPSSVFQLTVTWTEQHTSGYQQQES